MMATQKIQLATHNDKVERIMEKMRRNSSISRKVIHQSDCIIPTNISDHERAKARAVLNCIKTNNVTNPITAMPLIHTEDR